MAACDKCYWVGQCFLPDGCSDFTALEEANEHIDEIIEENRVKFYKEWNSLCSHDE